MSPDAILLKPVPVREHLRPEAVPPLSRALIAAGEGKQRGLRRLRLRLVKKLNALLYRRLGLGTAGRIGVAHPTDGWRSFTANFGNSGYVDALRRVGRGGYEPDVTDVMAAVAGALGTVYDIGTNWGYFTTALMSNPAFTGRIHGFEISPSTHADFSRMVAECGFADRVTAHAHGLSDSNGSVAIREGVHSGLTSVVAAGKGTRTAEVKRLDALGLPPPDLIKIDVEGHEMAVLEGARGVLETARPLVVLESWWQAHDIDRMLAPLLVLQAAGYRFYRIGWAVDLGQRRVFTATRPDDAAGRTNTLALVPLPVEQRPMVADFLNVLAVHPARQDSLLAGFTAA